MANKSAVTIDTRTAETLLKEIETIKKSLEVLKKKIIKLLPARYGSDAWWEKAELEADEDIKKGRIAKLSSIQDLDKPIKELFP